MKVGGWQPPEQFSAARFTLSLSEHAQVLVEHEDTITCVAVTEDNRFVISGSADKNLLVWSLSTGLAENKFVGHTDKVTTVKATKDSSVAVSGKVFLSCTFPLKPLDNDAAPQCNFHGPNGMDRTAYRWRELRRI